MLALREWSALQQVLLTGLFAQLRHAGQRRRELEERKHRNLAVASVTRKLTVCIWRLLMGHYTELEAAPRHLVVKLPKLATLLGQQALKPAGFACRAAFVRHLLQSIKNTSHNPARSS